MSPDRDICREEYFESSDAIASLLAMNDNGV